MRILTLVLGLLVSTHALAIKPAEKRAMRSTEHNLEAGYFALEVDRTVTTILRLATFQLRLRGHRDLARDLERSWEGRFRALLYSYDLGDHAALSAWLGEVYRELVEAIGPQTVKLLHLDDLHILNYSVPVVFDPHFYAVWCLETKPTGVACRDEYRLHFAGSPERGGHGGFAGVVSYWSVWAVCTAGTWGTGAAFACSPAGMLAEYLMQYKIAPDLSDRVWDRENPE